MYLSSSYLTRETLRKLTHRLSITFRHFIIRGKHLDATICLNLARALQISSETVIIAKTTAYFNAWNSHDIAALRTLFSTHIELHGTTGGT